MGPIISKYREDAILELKIEIHRWRCSNANMAQVVKGSGGVMRGSRLKFQCGQKKAKKKHLPISKFI